MKWYQILSLSIVFLGAAIFGAGVMAAIYEGFDSSFIITTSSTIVTTGMACIIMLNGNQMERYK